MIVALDVHTELEDALDLDAAARNLRRDLLLLDVDDVSLARTEVPDGARGDGVTIGTLILTLSNSAVLVAVCQVLRAWVLRGQRRRISLRLGTAEVEITGGTEAQNQQLIDAFLRSVSSADPTDELQQAEQQRPDP